MIYLKNSPRAFTLIELLVVISIIGILAAILIPAVGKVRGSANQTEDVAKIRSMAQAVLLYNSVNGYLPGRYNRAARMPGFVEEDNRDRWFSTSMAESTLSKAWINRPITFPSKSFEKHPTKREVALFRRSATLA